MPRKSVRIIPPKISYHATEFGTVKVIRQSVLCRLLMVRAISLWNRVYIQDSVITRRMWEFQLGKIRAQRLHGFWRNLPDILTN